MTQSQQKKIPTRESELCRRVRDLRGERNQRDFARFMGVTQAQVSAWERGTETPSAEKLLRMGNEAGNTADRLWFLRRAGFVVENLKADLHREGLLSLEIPREASESFAPLARRLSIGNAGEIQPDVDGNLVLPSLVFLKMGSVLCFQVPEPPGGIGLPGAWVTYPAGDVVVIERTFADLDDLEGVEVAVYFEEIPEYSEHNPQTAKFLQTVALFGDRERREVQSNRDLSQKIDPAGVARVNQQNEANWQRIQTAMSHPLVLFGYLRVQLAGGAKDEGLPWEKQYGRVVLETRPHRPVHSPEVFPLGEWHKGLNPAKRQIAKIMDGDKHVIGSVVGWLKNRQQQNIDRGEPR